VAAVLNRRARHLSTGSGVGSFKFRLSGSQERKILKGYEGDVAKDVIIMEEGNEPSFSGAISMMAGGLTLFIVCGALSNAFAKKTPVPPRLPPTIPPRFHHPSPGPTDRRA
jgi:hypothetical protein